MAACGESERPRPKGFDRLSPNGAGSTRTTESLNPSPSSVHPEPVEGPLPPQLVEALEAARAGASTGSARTERVGPPPPSVRPEPVEGPLSPQFVEALETRPKGFDRLSPNGAGSTRTIENPSLNRMWAATLELRAHGGCRRQHTRARRSSNQLGRGLAAGCALALSAGQDHRARRVGEFDAQPRQLAHQLQVDRLLQVHVEVVVG
jgi:hypothetical protein